MTTRVKFGHKDDFVYKRKKFFAKPDFTLRLDDIEGARSRKRTIHLGKRCTNPLNPRYKLPTEKSFLKLGKGSETETFKTTRTWFHDNSDIEKSSHTPYPVKIRENNFGDKIIERARQTADYRFCTERPNSLQVRDINYESVGTNKFRTNRHLNHSNPCQPEYLWDTQHSRGKKIGHVEKSISTKRIRNLNLKPKSNSDIHGATVVPGKYERTRKIRSPTDISDIQFAQASTKNKFVTKRTVCPLNPIYSEYNNDQPLDTPR